MHHQYTPMSTLLPFSRFIAFGLIGALKAMGKVMEFASKIMGFEGMIHALSNGKRADDVNACLTVPGMTLYRRDNAPTCYSIMKALIHNVFAVCKFNIIYVIGSCTATRGRGESDGAIGSYSKGVVYASSCRVMQESRVVHTLPCAAV